MTVFKKSLKIALAALFAIVIAVEMGLQSAATAGIITILSIGNTKRETLKSACNRGMAFLCALVMAGICFSAGGYNIWAFAVYLFFFSLLCLGVGWVEAIAMDSVLISHFLLAGNMAFELLVNEILLFVIGAGMGILVNLHLHPRVEEFNRLAEEVDNQIKGIIRRMAHWLLEEDKSEYTSQCFPKLEEALNAARDCAVANQKNTLQDSFAYEMEYISMRRQQFYVLQGIYENIKRICYLPDQAKQVAGLLTRIEQDYNRNNEVIGLLQELHQLLEVMKTQPLPENREEFEARAILFYILKQLESLLEIKRHFMQGRDSFDK